MKRKRDITTETQWGDVATDDDQRPAPSGKMKEDEEETGT